MNINDEVKNILEWVICIIIAVFLGLWIRYYLITPTQVKSVSMEPTLVQGQRLLLNRTIRLTKNLPKRGEIITFEAPTTEYLSQSQFNETPTARYTEIEGGFNKFVHNVLEIGKVSYIKRVIALPGEHVKIQNGKVYINDQELQEDYLSDSVITEAEGGLLVDFIVPEGTVFAMGDNRQNSHDCRAFGCIPLEKIESTVLVRFWPFDKFGKVE